MTQFDQSSLKEFSFKTADSELSFSKNDRPVMQPQVQNQAVLPTQEVFEKVSHVETNSNQEIKTDSESIQEEISGEIIESPLVGVAYLAAGPDKPNFVSVGDTVKKGQTLVIIEAMKVMNEVPAPMDGVVTEILVSNEEVIEFGQGLVRIK